MWSTTSSGLLNLLAYITGDNWSIAFRQSTRPPRVQGALVSRTVARSFDSIVPFSGGLDSVAALLLSKGAPLPVNTNANPSVATLARYVLEGTPHKERLTPLRVKMSKTATGQHPEPTYRTRTLLFFVIAAVAARLIGAARVIIGEAGQGSLGPSLVPFGGEHPYRASHPGTTYRLHNFLSRLWSDSPSDPPRFEHPFIWKTKGQVLSELVKRDEFKLWARTRSCSRDRRKAGGLFGRIGCGVCGGCILRQMSLHAAGIRVGREHAIQSFSGLPAQSADLQVLACSVLSLDHFSDLESSRRKKNHIFELATSELSIYLGIRQETARKNLSRLIRSHASEWKSFKNSRDAHSWIAGTP